MPCAASDENMKGRTKGKPSEAAESILRAYRGNRAWDRWGWCSGTKL